MLAANRHVEPAAATRRRARKSGPREPWRGTHAIVREGRDWRLVRRRFERGA